MTGERPQPPSLLYGFLPRLVSFVLAVAVTGWVLVLPTELTGPGNAVNYPVLLALMWGLAAGYTHGVGFIPRNGLLKLLLGPGPAWLLLLGGALWLLVKG